MYTVYLYFKDVFVTAYLLRKGTRFLPNHVFATILYHSMSVEGIDDGQDKKKKTATFIIFLSIWVLLFMSERRSSIFYENQFDRNGVYEHKSASQQQLQTIPRESKLDGFHF